MTEPAAPTTRRGEPGLLGGDGQVGAGDQLAAGRRGEAVYPRHHRLRNPLDRSHQVGTRGEEMAHAVQIALHHVGEVVPRAEDRSVGGEDHGARLLVRSQRAERVGQLLHVRLGEGVAPFGPIHGDGPEPGVGRDDDVFVSHGDSLAVV